MAGNVDAALSLFSNDFGSRSQGLPFPYLREFDQHRQVDACHDLDLVLIEKRGGDVGGCTAEHIGQNQNTIGTLDPFQRLFDHAGRRPDIVVPSERNRGGVVNFTDNHLRRVQKLDGQPTVSNDEPADHNVKC